MTTKFFTNKDDNSLFDKFKGVFTHQNIHCFDALVGYFRASGYFKLRPFLENVPETRVLVGIDVDSLTQKYHSKGQLYFQKTEETKEDFLKFIRKDIHEAEYKKDIEEGILQFVEDIISGKIKVKASGENKLHAKIYIFRPEPFNEHTPASVITGSSNLTDAGMGTGDVRNYEFNVLLQDHDDVKFATNEFEGLWASAIDILPADAGIIKRKTHLNENITPFDLYIKVLIEYFGNSVEYDPTIGDDLPKGYLKLKYQIDAVNDGFKRLIQHRGFVLADVVGLGKTLIATMVLKKYIQKNGSGTRVLVVYPPALATNWQTTIKDFKLQNHVDFITNGSLHKIIDPDNYTYNDPEDYDLVVIDESHKFRSDTSQMYALLQLITKTPRKNIGHDTDRNKKVILVSATPLNNRPEDIANQIYLFQDARSSTIDGVHNLQKFFAARIKEYKELKNVSDNEELIEKVKQIYLPIRDKIMIPLVIRRTRADINSITEYKEDLKSQNMRFPSVIGPQDLIYHFDDNLNEIFYKTVNYLINNDDNGLKYFRYRAIEFLLPEHKEKYDNAALISKQLASIMRTLLVKRLESSFFAFKQSLKRFCESNSRMITMFENDKVFIAPDLNVNKLLEDGKEDELEQKIIELNEINPNNDIYKKKDFEDNFLADLIKDNEILSMLVYEWDKIEYDPKLDKFIHSLKTKLLDKNNLEKKLVIFTESKETVDYLAGKMKDSGFKKVLAISAKNQKNQFRTIRQNFDANYNQTDQKNDFDIIISTEVLAEGINLHRSNVVLNYDIPWNATRLMQRIGRVNRIGTKASKIFVYNFKPSAQGNKQIKLNEKALQKLQGFHTAFSEDSKIYDELEQLQENILGELEAKEEIDERLQYLFFLRKYKEKNPTRFDKIKALPAKSRTGRDSEVIEKTNVPSGLGQLNNTTISYIRSRHKDEFYISYGSESKELTFYEAIKVLEAKASEKPLPLNKEHFSQIEKALHVFGQTIDWQGDNDLIKGDLAVQERNSINYMNQIKDFASLNKEDYISLIGEIETATNIIYKGIFKNFRNELAREARTVKKINKSPKTKISPEEAVLRLQNIFNKYPIQMIQKMEKRRLEESEREKEESRLAKPQIILSESFI
ncbi:helicase-related protein [uncultured Draconibacterium sp.]|uniref:helicase-related protein n=1 Tax=uncultured Draconibacterium sp. TaxID=1573823 RepID=UPI003217BB7F